MRGIDLLFFAIPAVVFVAGALAPSTTEWMVQIAMIAAVVGAVGVSSALGLIFRSVMNFADDAGIRRGWPHAVHLIVRFGSLFWFWLALAFVGLALVYPEWRLPLQRMAWMAGAFGCAIFIVGMSWFLIYAAAKKNVHRPVTDD